jgi:TolA-binding protein
MHSPVHLARPLSTTGLLASAVLVSLLAACGGGGKGGGGGTLAPDEALYQEALRLFDSGRTADAAMLGLLAPPPDAAAAQLQFDLALQRFLDARAELDDLAVRFPTSARRDDAAYLAGRCSYEAGSLFPAPVTAPAAGTEASFFQDAAARLDAMRATFSSSPLLAQASYFAGRARFRLAPSSAAVEAGYEAARADFALSLSQAPGGLYADNAQYFLGRTWYELAHVALATSPAVASERFASARAELARVASSFPQSSYVDNANYYLGRSWYDAPAPTDLVQAMAAFTLVVNVPASAYHDAALYYRGRSHYTLARPAAGAPPADEVQQLNDGLADFQRLLADHPASSFADGATFWSGRCRYALALLDAAVADFHAVEAWPGKDPYPANTQWLDNALRYDAQVRVDQATLANDATRCDLACPPIAELATWFTGGAHHLAACGSFAASPVCGTRPAGGCAGCP